MSDFSYDDATAVPPPPRPIEGGGTEARWWWASILVGLALVGVGLWMVSNLYESVLVLGLLAGFSLVVTGVAEIVGLGGRGGLGVAAWFGGGIVIVFGLVMLAWPDITLLVLAVIAGGVSLGVGLVRIAVAFENRKVQSDWTVDLIVGLVGSVLGMVILAWPSATLMVLGLILGIRALVTGVVALAVGWKLHGVDG